MQTTLLGLAIAVILALVSALVAPLVVDWNHYRAPIEAEASRLTGLSVRVDGVIDARLLPSPVVTLREVEIGAAGQAPRLRAGTLKLELGLGPLLRGKVQASQVDLIEPHLRLALDSSGAVEWPGPAPSFNAQALSVTHFSVENGSIAIADAVSGSQLTLQKLYFNGDVASLAGPFNGEGAVVVDDELYGYTISGSPADGGGTKLRLSVDPSDRPLTAVFDGTLAFAGHVPQFDGTLALSRPVGATLPNGQRVVSEPWRATGSVRADPAAASLQNLELRYGPEERALNFTGSAELRFGAHAHLAGKVSALQLDVDRALAAPDLTDRPPLLVLRSFLQTFVASAKLPVPAQIGVSVDALTVGHTTIESLSGEVNFDPAGWSLDSLQFRAPGMTQVNLSGRLTGSVQGFAFAGPASLASADFEVLLAWLDGHGSDRAAAGAKTLSAQGAVTIASDRIAVEQLKAALDREAIEGRLAYRWPVGKRAARLDAELRAGQLDLDALATFAKSAAGGVGFALPQEATLALDIGKATFAGVDARAVNAQVKLDAGKLQIDRLSVGDLAGAKLDISGRIDELSSQPRGQLTLDVDARALDGFSDIAAKFVPQAAAALRRAAVRLAPAQVHAVLDVERAATSGSVAELHVSGNLASMRLDVDGKATGEPSHPGAANVQIDGRLDADDGSALLALFGLDRVLAVDQLPGRLTLAAAGPLDGDIHVDGKVASSGFDSMIAGTLRLSGERTPSGKLQLQAAAGDMRPLNRAMTGEPGAAVPVTARAALALDGAKLSFTDIAATFGKSAVKGTIAVDWANPIGIGGDVEVDEVDAARVLTMLLGMPVSGPQWSSDKIGAGAFAAMTGAVNFKFDNAAFTPALVAHDLTGVAHFAPSGITLDNLDGGLADGRVGGSLALRRNPNGLAAHAKIDLADVAAAAIVGATMNVSGGKLSATLASDGFGASPAGLIGSLHGGGTVKLQDAQFAGLDAAAFDGAMRAAGQSGPIDIGKVDMGNVDMGNVDMGKVKDAVNAALANGHVDVPQGEATVTIASGTINLNRVTMQAAGGAQLTLDGAIDLSNAAIDARMSLSEAPPASALIRTRPEISVDIKGPVAAPQRRLDISALTSWLTLSAAERQTRIIQSIEANQRAAVPGQASHPAPPDAHILSPGTDVESAVPPNLLSAPVPGSFGLERLQQPSTLPTAPPQNRSGAFGAEKHAAPAVRAPPAGGSGDPLQPHSRGSAATVGAAEQSRPLAVPQNAAPGVRGAD